MIKLIKFFTFIPFIKRLYYRKYYATGVGVYLINSFFKRILRVNSKGDFLVNFTSKVNTPKELIVKEGAKSSSVYLSLATSGGCYYQAINGIEFGEGTIWANNCSFISANHSFKDLKKHLPSKKIKIGRNVWLGSNCIVLPEVEIGDNVIVGAGSVVTKSIPENSIVIGSPAKIIAKRCSNCLDKMSINSNNNKCKNCI